MMNIYVRHFLLLRRNPEVERFEFATEQEARSGRNRVSVIVFLLKNV